MKLSPPPQGLSLETVQQVLCAFDCNAFQVLSAAPPHLTLMGLYPRGHASLANHSCSPNARPVIAAAAAAAAGRGGTRGNRRWTSGELRLVACADISAGEEISVSYVTAAFLTTGQRRTALATGKYFQCDCRR